MITRINPPSVPEVLRKCAASNVSDQILQQCKSLAEIEALIGTTWTRFPCGVCHDLQLSGFRLVMADFWLVPICDECIAILYSKIPCLAGEPIDV